MQMSNILITGATGFIGSNLARTLSKSGDRISIFLKRQPNLWRLKDIISQFDTYVVDISNPDMIKQKIMKIKPDIVYHCATYGVYPFQKDLNTIIQTNVIGSANLMQVLAKYNDLEKFINIGSVFEYGPKLKPAKETDIVKPVTTYGIAKVAQTHLAQYFALANNLPTVTLRIFTTYGTYEERGRLIPDIMFALIRKTHLNLACPAARRDFIYVDDVINALIKTAKTRGIEGEIFNIGGGREYNVQEIVDLAQEISQTNLRISSDYKKQLEFDRIVGTKTVFANIEKARKVLSWKPKYSIKEGLKKTYDWYKKNIQLYRD
jgi:nucleoside-diphosphate-sugar epimerase